MVNVDYSVNKDGSFKEVEIKGHADSSEIVGHDLVCAAVSSITVGALNALNEIDNYDIKIENGHIRLKSRKKFSRHDSVVIETMMVQLATIEDSYGDFIKIKNH